jgi:hypothetical protein
MLRLVSLVAALLGALLFASTSTVITAAATTSAQTPEVDVQTTAATVSAVEPTLLATALQQPMTADALPAGFTSAAYFDSNSTPGASNQGSEPGIVPTANLPGTLASIAYTIEGDPTVLGGIASINSINYVVVNPNELSDDVLGDIRSGIEQGLATPVPSTTQFAIEDVELGGAPALLLTFTVTDASVNAVVQMHVVPVGNVVVVGLVTIADQAAVDPASALAPSQELTLAGISHLGTVAQGLSG